MNAPFPRGFRTGHDDSLACPHRDLSCCAPCAAAHVKIVDVLSRHYWISDADERTALIAEAAGETCTQDGTGCCGNDGLPCSGCVRESAARYAEAVADRSHLLAFPSPRRFR